MEEGGSAALSCPTGKAQETHETPQIEQERSPIGLRSCSAETSATRLAAIILSNPTYPLTYVRRRGNGPAYSRPLSGAPGCPLLRLATDVSEGGLEPL